MIKASNSLLVISKIGIDLTSTGIGPGEIRLQCNSAIEVGNSPLIFLTPSISSTTLYVRLPKFRFEFNCAIKIVHGSLVLVKVASVGYAALKISPGGPGIEFDRALKVCDSFLVLILMTI